MDWVSICTSYYQAGYYDNTSLKVFVVKGKITGADYKTITGIDYVA
ncbi:phage uncharacterized protein, XkdX family [Desulfosporosinus acidiphilus SJ4]|uniref:Phage uncharacterized protein, XkdX family n=1 Tax=Desulfosporosinus acidiphilus (strain DSM 22704 / JCM 16185 / SJ4) TaxID=646529 RepID=I4D3H4_DESAJ|nr:XkdX family protein [Desulfosporosinus acidiphilus]AFM40348.1 phage uncharacterized protein, XkdX family [Desulfosporosinus acidiphilus SJ4]